MTNITECKLAEEQLQRLNRALKARSDSSHALLHATDESAYLQEVCRIVTEDCGLAMMWVGFAENDENKTVRPVASAGFEDGYLETLKLRWDDSDYGRGPTGMAVRTGQPSMCRNMLTDPRFLPWREGALKRGYASSLVIPLLEEKKAFGAFSIYSRESDGFSEAEVSLLTELAADLSFGIRTLRLRAAHTQAEEALRESEIKHRDLSNSIPALLWATNAQGVTIHHNRQWHEYTGQSLEHGHGDGWKDIIFHDDLEPVAARWDHSLRTGEDYSIEYRIRRASDGAYRWHSAQGRLSRDEQGKPLGWFGTLVDIHDRRQTEEALRASEARFRGVLDSSRDFIYRTNVQTGRYEYLSPSVRTVMGFTPDELMSIGHEASLAMIHPDDLPIVQAWLARLEDTCEGELEYRLRAGDGEYRWLSNHASIAKDGAGRPLYRNGNVRDITDRKRAEEALLQNEAMLRAVIEQMPSGVTVRDARTGNMITSNARAELLMGRLAESINDYSAYIAFHPDGRPVSKEEWPLARSAATGEVVIGEDIIYHPPDGACITLRTNSAPIRDSEGQVVAAVSVFDDISERKRVEAALLRSEKLASVGRMASTIAHEINNPLETIGQAVYLALTDPGTSAKAKSYLDMAAQELERVAHITRQTLAFHREKNASKLIDLRESIESILKLFAPRLKSRGVTVEERYREVEQITASSVEVRQVLANLLSNSMDAVPNQGKIHIRLSRSLGKHGSRLVRFTIGDTGSGIPAEFRKKIFEPFFTTKEVVGTGLGLWVTKQIVEKHGASIRVRSKPGQGTVFSIGFPIAGSREDA
jgi:PAS domain S-box-containing protein